MKQHMRKQEFIILSAELSHLPKMTNSDRSIRLEGMLEDLNLPYKQLTGFYKGSSEISFMVIVKDESEIEVVKDLGLKTFEQESVLFRDYKGNASLIYGDGMTQSIGRFQQVDDVDFEDNYSVVEGNFWVCR